MFSAFTRSGRFGSRVLGTKGFQAQALGIKFRHFSSKIPKCIYHKGELGEDYINTEMIRRIQKGKTFFGDKPMYSIDMGGDWINIKKGNPAYQEVEKVVNGWKRMKVPTRFESNV